MNVLYWLRCRVLDILEEWKCYQEYRALRRAGATLSWMPPEHPNCLCVLKKIDEA